MINVSLAAEPVFYIGSLAISNSLLSAFIITLFIAAGSILAHKRLALIPGRLQVLLEIITEFVLEQLRTAFGSEKKARAFFPVIMTVLLFIVIANQFSMVPLLYQITYGGKAVLRTATSDLTLTLAMAALMIISAQVLAFAASPLTHIGKYIKIGPLLKARTPAAFGNAFLDLFLGILDIIGEISKILSMSFRLFGNVFAGEVLVAVITGLSIYTTFFIPIPFMIISIFSGFVQAFVFMLLSIQFIAGTIGTQAAQEQTAPQTV